MQKHIIYLGITLCFSLIKLSAQSPRNPNTNTFSYQITSNFNAKGAEKDIKKNNIRILFAGGFTGIPNFKNDKDTSFQEKYSVKFFSQGCVRMGENENEEEYNHIIFNYLDKKFGENWRSEIRKDAIGFKQL